MLFAACVIVSAVAMTELYEERPQYQWKDLLFYLFAIVNLVTVKSGLYMPLIFLPFWFRYLKLEKTKKKWIGIVVCMMCLLAFLLLIRSSLWQNIVLAYHYTYYNMYFEMYGKSIAYYVTHLKETITIFLHTFQSQGILYLRGMVGGFLGWRQNIIISSKIIGLIYILLLLNSCNTTEEDVPVVKKKKLSLCPVLLIYILLTMFTMLVRWSPPSPAYIEGVQGRYFLPVFLLILLVMRGIFPLRIHIQQKYLYLFLLLLDQLVFGACIWMTCL